MKLPTKIKILGVPWKITYCENASEVNIHKREALWGECDPWTKSIRVYVHDIPYEEILRILIHECIHAFCGQLHVDKLNDDETLIDVVAYNIMDIFTTNGWLKDELE